MRTAIVLHDPGIGEQKVEISGWLVEVGDEVIEGDRVLECVTRGATFDVQAPLSGKLIRVTTPVGTQVKPMDILGWLETGHINHRSIGDNWEPL